MQRGRVSRTFTRREGPGHRHTRGGSTRLLPLHECARPHGHALHQPRRGTAGWPPAWQLG